MFRGQSTWPFGAPLPTPPPLYQIPDDAHLPNLSHPPLPPPPPHIQMIDTLEMEFLVHRQKGNVD